MPRTGVNVTEIVLLCVLAVLIILFAGDPDISDAIRTRIFRCGS